MALTKQTFTAANTETFAEALTVALSATGLFDSVTRSTLVVTATKDSQDILKVDTGTWNSVIVFKNKNGTTLNTVTLDQGTSTLGSYASISTDGHFVHCILTNTYGGGGIATNALILGVFGTKSEEIALFHTKHYYSQGVCYPPNYCWLSNSASLATDGGEGGGSSVLLPRSYNHGCLASYPLTSVTAEGGVDIVEGAYGIICAPPMFTLAKSQAGVTPPTIVLNGKQYLTDGVLLINVNN